METDSLLAKSRSTTNSNASSAGNKNLGSPLFRRDRSSEKLTHHNYRSVELQRDLEAQYSDGFHIGQLYRYNPTDKCPRFSVYRLPQTKDEKMFQGNINRKQLFVCVERVDQRWVKIASSQMEGWVSLPTSFQSDRAIFQPIINFIAYEDSISRHFFFWGGRCLIGPDTDYFLFTVVIMPVSLIAYLFTVANRFTAIYGVLLMLSSIGLIIFSMTNLVITATMDPGIIPRQSPHSKKLPTPSEEANLIQHGWKFCQTCNIYRPPRAKHCRLCDCCVDKFDHHCPFVSTCVGRRNERYFVRFLFALTLYILQVTFSSLILIIVHVLNDPERRAILRLADALLAHPTALAFVFLGVTITPIFLRFSAYHCHLRCVDRTTNELETHRQQQQQPLPQQTSPLHIASVTTQTNDNTTEINSTNMSSGGDGSPVSYQKLPYQFFPIHHDFARHGNGGWQNWHDVCCQEVTNSRLGDMTKHCTTIDFLRAHIDGERYAHILQRYSDHTDNDIVNITEMTTLHHGNEVEPDYRHHHFHTNIDPILQTEVVQVEEDIEELDTEGKQEEMIESQFAKKRRNQPIRVHKHFLDNQSSTDRQMDKSNDSSAISSSVSSNPLAHAAATEEDNDDLLYSPSVSSKKTIFSSPASTSSMAMLGKNPSELFVQLTSHSSFSQNSDSNPANGELERLQSVQSFFMDNDDDLSV